MLGSRDDVCALADKLATIEWIDQDETPHDEPPSWTLASSLSDIEVACRELLDKRLPQLIPASSRSELSSSFRDIRVDLQHIAYHLASTPSLRSLIDNAPPLQNA